MASLDVWEVIERSSTKLGVQDSNRGWWPYRSKRPPSLFVSHITMISYSEQNQRHHVKGAYVHMFGFINEDVIVLWECWILLQAVRYAFVILGHKVLATFGFPRAHSYWSVG